MKKLIVLGILVALALILPVQASAITLYSDRAAWIAANPGFADVDISGIPEFSTVTSIGLPFGETLSFSSPMTRLQVGSSWATWCAGCGLPPILYTAGASSVTAGFGPGPVAAFGLEMEPNPFAVLDMTLALSDGSFLTQPVDGAGGAKFFGWSGGSVTAMTLSCPTCGDFGFGRMVKAESGAVPEPSTLLLLGLGLVGLAAWRRFKVRD